MAKFAPGTRSAGDWCSEIVPVSDQPVARAAMSFLSFVQPILHSVRAEVWADSRILQRHGSDLSLSSVAPGWLRSALKKANDFSTCERHREDFQKNDWRTGPSAVLVPKLS